MKIKLLFLALIVSITAYGQDTLQFTPRGFDSTIKNEFRYLGGSIASISDKTSDLDQGYLNCLYIGKINMRMTLNQVDSILGKSDKIFDQKDSQIHVYFLPTTEKYYPYYAITFKNNIVNSIQLTGLSTTDSISFSSIKLGDHYKTVLEILGKPSNIKAIEDIKGVEWTYFPFPISIEFVARKVYSIKIYDK
ncbi:MAG TPA: hypothetical protein PK333_04570 [Candidatus Moranbacteria bacterium]|nr:hypothetical protein [Candidatus Moranbacteria bacterium]